MSTKYILIPELKRESRPLSDHYELYAVVSDMADNAFRIEMSITK
jgi:hypothetical protein